MKRKYTLRERTRYLFDNIMNRGMAALILLLLVITVLFIFLMGLLVILVTGKPLSLLPEGFWLTLVHTLDPGTVSGTEGTILFMALMLLATFYGLFFTATLIGFINDGISVKMQSLAKGRGKILESNHILILGFNDATMTLLHELIAANENQKTRQPVVILDEVDAADMEEQIRIQLPEAGNPGKTDIICRRGTIYDINDLERCAIEDSRSIIINAETDFDTIKAILASTYILNHAKNKTSSYAVAVVYSDDNEDAARIAGNDGLEDDRLEMLLLQKTLARIMVHTSRQPGLSVVFTELFNFANMEFYLVDRDPALEKLAGMTVREINHFLKSAIALGVYHPGEGTIIDAPGEVVFRKGDSLLVVEEDDNPLLVEKTPRECRVTRVSAIPAQEGGSILILGIQPIINNVLKEYVNYMPAGTRFYAADAGKKEHGRIRSKVINQVEQAGCQLTIEEGINYYELETMNSLLNRTKPDTVLLLLDHENDPEEEDEKIVKLLLYLRQYRKQTGRHFNITSEINLVRDQKLANATGSDDFIISRQISALLMSQISLRREMRNVFTTLLSKKGFEIYIKKAVNYVPLHTELDLYSVIDAVAEKHELFLGLRRKAEERYEQPVVNPPKYNENGDLIMYRFHEEDCFVVLSEDMSVS